MFLANKIVGAVDDDGPHCSHYGQSDAVADEPLLIQPEAVLSELPIVLPSVTAARAMAPPTMARINAYSAAEAPDSSLSMEMKGLMILTPNYVLIRDYGQSLEVADEPFEIQFEVVFSELPIVLPSVMAARAIAPPTIARISAYSAAEAPD
jgi:hypothetical protein